MRILGIDPGLQVCGYACIESKSGETTLLEGGVIRTTASKAIETRLNQIAEDIDSILDKFKPDVVGVEQLYSHYAHPRTAILMGHARGVILQRCAEAVSFLWNFYWHEQRGKELAYELFPLVSYRGGRVGHRSETA